MKDNFTDKIYQCDGFMAIEHLYDGKRTKCGTTPTNKQFGHGTFAYEYGDMPAQYRCQICRPEFGKETK